MPLVEYLRILLERRLDAAFRFDTDAKFIGTLNAKKLGVLEFTLTNENGETAETGNNKVFTIDNLDSNRVILDFSIVTRK